MKFYFIKKYAINIYDSYKLILMVLKVPPKLSKELSHTWLGWSVSDEFTVRNGLKKGNSLSPSLFIIILDYVTELELLIKKVG